MSRAEHLDLTPLAKAANSLESCLKILSDRQWLSLQSPEVKKALEAGAIQNFEIVYELSVKFLKRRLEMDAANPPEIEQASFRDLLRIGGEAGLVDEVEHWFEYRRKRNITSHTYDEGQAAEVLAALPGFLQDLRLLQSALERRNG